MNADSWLVELLMLETIGQTAIGFLCSFLRKYMMGVLGFLTDVENYKCPS